MTQISKIITQSQTHQELNNINFHQRRPWVKISKDEFMTQIIQNANEIFKIRGIVRNFEIDLYEQEIIDQLFLYATQSPLCKLNLNKGIAMLGSIGSGKTVLMESFLKIFNKDLYSKNVTILSSCEYVRKISNNPDYIDSLKFRPLYLDDIGKESQSIKIYGSEIQPIPQLVNTRYDNGGITYFTSNYNLKTLAKHYGETCADRLNEMCNFIIKEGDSKRI